MSRLLDWFQKRVIDYAGRNPIPVSISVAAALGATYAAEQQFEHTNFCKRLWVAAHLAQRTYFETESVHLHNPSLHNAFQFSLSRDMSQHDEQIDVIAGSMGIGKTTETKFQLNGRRGVVYVDLHKLADDLDDQQRASAVNNLVLQAISFRKHPKGDLQEACAVYADVSRLLVRLGLDPTCLVLDGANEAVTLKPGKKPKSGLLKLLCVTVSPAGRVLCLSSGFSALSMDQVSHVGARVRIMLGEPVRDDDALLTWSGRTFPNWTEQQRSSAVQTLNGNFGDYKEVSKTQVQNQLPFSDALCRLQQKKYKALRDDALGFRKAPTPNTPRNDLGFILERFRVVQEITSSPSKRIYGGEPAIDFLVEKGVLSPQSDGIVADSRIKQAAMERLVKSPFVRTRVEQVELLLAGPTGGWFQSGTSGWNQKLAELEAKARREFGTED